MWIVSSLTITRDSVASPPHGTPAPNNGSTTWASLPGRHGAVSADPRLNIAHRASPRHRLILYHRATATSINLRRDLPSPVRHPSHLLPGRDDKARSIYFTQIFDGGPMTEYGYVGGGTRQKTSGEDCTRCTHNKRGPGVLSGLPY